MAEFSDDESEDGFGAHGGTGGNSMLNSLPVIGVGAQGTSSSQPFVLPSNFDRAFDSDDDDSKCPSLEVGLVFKLNC